MWGTLRVRDRVDFQARFIPTHVGNAFPDVSGYPTSTVHPHACGERRYEKISAEKQNGSSPRMWGTRRLYNHIYINLRFIPTHVGNAICFAPASTTSPVHPHACGERIEIIHKITGRVGSSPRMWGTRTITISDFENLRFIPTHVGNAVWVIPAVWVFPVHPHACGERFVTEHRHRGLDGSSPRMWGTRPKCPCCKRDSRFIPTHVGNALIDDHRFVIIAVHPHACGERLITGYSLNQPVGSSPRMWGTLFKNLIATVNGRFIPTHVGNAFLEVFEIRTTSVHPHACGERACCISYNIVCAGSSPRMWGTQVQQKF